MSLPIAVHSSPGHPSDEKTNTGEGGIAKKHRTTSTRGQCGGERSTGSRLVVIRTSVNIFEVVRRDNPQYFVDVVKDKWRTKNNNLEFLSGDVTFLTPRMTRGSLSLICQVQNTWSGNLTCKSNRCPTTHTLWQYLSLLCLLRGSSVVWDLYRLTFVGGFWTPPQLTWCGLNKNLSHLGRDEQRGHTHTTHTHTPILPTIKPCW